ncbi:hypothetical protein CR513_13913, partial [Mucuna pruriens]
MDPTKHSKQMTSNFFIPNRGTIDNVLIAQELIHFMHKKRSNPGKLHAYDPEIDKTLHRLLRNPWNSEHPTEDHLLFGIDVIDKLVEEHTKLDAGSDEMPSFVEIINVLDYAASVAEAIDSIEMSEVSNLSDFGEVCKYDKEPEHVKCVGIQIADRKADTSTSGNNNKCRVRFGQPRPRLDAS